MDKTKQWSLLTALAVVVVLAGGWFLGVAPQRAKAADLRTQAIGQEQSNLGLQQQIARLKAQAKDLPAQQARLADISARIPDNPALPALVRSLSDAADAAGVDLVAITPAQPAAVTAPTSAGASTLNAPAGAAGLSQITVGVEVNGGFFQVEQFLSNLESLKRAFLVQKVDAAPGTALVAPVNGAAPSSSDAYTGTLHATVSGQVFLAPTAATAAPTAGTATLAPSAAGTPSK